MTESEVGTVKHGRRTEVTAEERCPLVELHSVVKQR